MLKSGRPRVSYNSVVEHSSRRPVFHPLCSYVNRYHVWPYWTWRSCNPWRWMVKGITVYTGQSGYVSMLWSMLSVVSLRVNIIDRTTAAAELTPSRRARWLSTHDPGQPTPSLPQQPVAEYHTPYFAFHRSFIIYCISCIKQSHTTWVGRLDSFADFKV